jgi:hypothetical protein
MHDKGLYSPLSYWAVLEILVRVRDAIGKNSKVPVGGREDMDKFKDIAGNHTSDGRLDPTDAVVYYAIQQYNGHLDISRVLATIAAAFQDDSEILLRSIGEWAERTLDGEPSLALPALTEVIVERKYLGIITAEEQELVRALCRVSGELTGLFDSPRELARDMDQFDPSNPEAVIACIASRLETFGIPDATVHLRSMQTLPNGKIVQVATVVQTSNRTAPFWVTLPATPMAHRPACH